MPSPRRIIVHVDMNSYFASVEQQANPFLRGKAVGVCAYLHPHGCVIAASVEAKQLGIKVGMTVAQAQAKVPSAEFLENDPPKYRMVTSKLFAILHELSDHVEHYSIDEAFVDLTGWCRDEAEAAFLLSRVKYRITTEIGEWLRCSIGIAPTRFLAKFASDFQKPNGLVMINQGNMNAFFEAAKLEDAHGIGPRTRKRLEALGIFTLLDLQRYPVENLMRVFGKAGFYFWCHLNGIEHERIQDGTSLPKSIGHSYRVPNRVNRAQLVEPVLVKLIERAGRRLRQQGLLAGGLSLVVGIRSNQGYRSEFCRFDEPQADSFVLTDRTCRLLHEIWQGEPVDFLAVTLVDLSVPSDQLQLGGYGDPVAQRTEIPSLAFSFPDKRRRAVSASMDAVRNRYGDRSIVLGRMYPLLRQDEAPDRIGFRKTVGVEAMSSFLDVTHEEVDLV